VIRFETPIECLDSIVNGGMDHRNIEETAAVVRYAVRFELVQP
jgi:hypothetical protein